MIACRPLAIGALLLATFGLGALPASAQTGEPSRPAEDKCVWERLLDADVGLAAWGQNCDFGFRQVRMMFDQGALAIKFSDGGNPDPLVEVLPMLPDEDGETALKRIFAERTAPIIAARCVLAPSHLIEPPPGVERFTFVPDAAYQAELDAKADPNEVPEPACGDYGDMPDSIQYFEVQPQSGARAVLFVQAGQDAPLFDEQTLQLLPKAPVEEARVGPNGCCGFEAGKAGVGIDYLLESCWVQGDTAYGLIPYFDCQSYILAVVDTIRTLNEGTEASICIPEDVTAGAVLALLEGRYDGSADGEQRAAEVLLRAMREAYACLA